METSSPKQTHFAANFVSLFTKFCFGAEYSSAWHLLFASVLPVLFENCENLDSTLNVDLKTCLNNVIRLHDSSISCATLTQAIDRCVLSAIKFIGPDIVLPIQDISQSTWLLPLLAQTRSQHATLAQFIAHFQPQQLWNLLPAFSASPIDLSLNFSQLASPLCAILTSNAHFRSPILTSIKLILAHVLSNHADYKKNMEALSSHTKPFLSILLALYSDFHSAKDELRFVVIVCIKVFSLLSN